MYTKQLKEMQDGMEKRDCFLFLHGYISYINATGKIPAEESIMICDSGAEWEEKYKIMFAIYQQIHNEIKSK